MKKEKDGLIINISSWAGREVSLLSGVTYTSSKHAVNAMTETINMKYCNFGIRACALCPGEVSTPILDKRPKKLSEEQARHVKTTSSFFQKTENKYKPHRNIR